MIGILPNPIESMGLLSHVRTCVVCVRRPVCPVCDVASGRFSQIDYCITMEVSEQLNHLFTIIHETHAVCVSI